MDNNHTPQTPTGVYDLATAAAVCTLIEPLVAKHGFHVALTGGCLYGEGGRKDIDLVFYRIRQVLPSTIDYEAMYRRLEIELSMVLQADHGFVKKFKMGEIPLDCMFPEAIYGHYTVDGIAAMDDYSNEPFRS